MWIIIFFIIALVLGKFFWDKHKLELSIKNRGGMLIVYKDLIDLLMATHPDSKIFSETASNIRLGVANSYTITLFDILENFKVITITYRIKSKFFGEHKLVWEFDKKEDPEFIMYKMNADIKAYLVNKKLF